MRSINCLPLQFLFLWLLFPAETIALAQGGPPLQTDDPGTPGDGVWEINLAAAMEKRRGERILEAPLVDVNYGVGETVQLKLEIPWIFHQRDGEGSRNGPGNSTLGVKWRFFEEDRHWVDVSLYPQVEFNNPTSSARRGIVDGGTELFLPFQFRKDFGRLSFNPEIGFAILEESADEWVLGLAVGFEILAEVFELIGEIRDVASSDFKEGELIFNLGCRWNIHRHLVLHGSAGRSFRPSSSGEPDLLAYLGVQLIFDTIKAHESK